MANVTNKMINGWVKDAFRKMGKPGLDRKVPWAWNTRLTSAMGRALWSRGYGHPPGGVKHHMQFSVRLFKAGSVDNARQTVYHECAHIVDLLTGGRGKHGYSWKTLMIEAGCSPKRCHNIRIPTGNKLPAFCNCNEPVYITVNMAKKINLGAKYKCRECRTYVVLRQTNSIAATTASIPIVATAAPKKGKRQYRCRACGELGHNARTCEKYSY